MAKDALMDHFMNPRNAGELVDANGVGEVGNPICGDIIRFFLKITDGKVEKASFKTFGCRAAIATSSILTEFVKGKTTEQVKGVTRDEIAEMLGNLPPLKRNCAKLAEFAVKSALGDYFAKTTGDEKLSTEIADRIHDAREWSAASFVQTAEWTGTAPL